MVKTSANKQLLLLHTCYPNYVNLLWYTYNLQYIKIYPSEDCIPPERFLHIEPEIDGFQSEFPLPVVYFRVPWFYMINNWSTHHQIFFIGPAAMVLTTRSAEPKPAMLNPDK